MSAKLAHEEDNSFLCVSFPCMHTMQDVVVLAGERSKMMKVFCPICGKVYKNPYIASCGVCTYICTQYYIVTVKNVHIVGLTHQVKMEGARGIELIMKYSGRSHNLTFFEKTCIVSVQ